MNLGPVLLLVLIGGLALLAFAIRQAVKRRKHLKAVEEARMERIVSATEKPATVHHYEAGVVMVGDHNEAHDVTTHFGTDQSALLSQLVAALGAVAQNAELQPQVREAAGQAAAELESAGPSQIPAIIERIRGIVSVAASGFEVVRPILEVLGSMN